MGRIASFLAVFWAVLAVGGSLLLARESPVFSADQADARGGLSASDPYGTAADRARLQRIAQRRTPPPAYVPQRPANDNWPRVSPSPNNIWRQPTNNNSQRVNPGSSNIWQQPSRPAIVQTPRPQAPSLRTPSLGAPRLQQPGTLMTKRGLPGPRMAPTSIVTYKPGLPGATRQVRIARRDPRTGQLRTTVFRPRAVAAVNGNVRRSGTSQQSARDVASRNFNERGSARSVRAIRGIAQSRQMVHLASLESGVRRVANDFTRTSSAVGGIRSFRPSKPPSDNTIVFFGKGRFKFGK